MTANVILMGLRGSGKSTLGRRLAESLSRPFVDLDDWTPRELGCGSVAEAWTRGEAVFRGAEFAALGNVLKRGNQIVSLGGGTPTAPGAAAMLRHHRDKGVATLVYLRATPATLRSRLAGADNSHRPPLTAGVSDPLMEIEAIFRARDPLYQELATEVIETDGQEEGVILGAIREALAER